MDYIDGFRRLAGNVSLLGMKISVMSRAAQSVLDDSNSDKEIKDRADGVLFGLQRVELEVANMLINVQEELRSFLPEDKRTAFNAAVKTLSEYRQQMDAMEVATDGTKH